MAIGELLGLLRYIDEKRNDNATNEVLAKYAGIQREPSYPTTPTPMDTDSGGILSVPKPDYSGREGRVELLNRYASGLPLAADTRYNISNYISKQEEDRGKLIRAEEARRITEPLLAKWNAGTATPSEIAVLQSHYGKEFNDISSPVYNLNKYNAERGDKEKELAANEALKAAVVGLKPTQDIQSWNSNVDTLMSVPNADFKVIRDYINDMEGRRKGVSGKSTTTTSKTGPVTENKTVQLDMFGRPLEGTGAATQFDSDASARSWEGVKVAREQLNQGKANREEDTLFKLLDMYDSSSKRAGDLQTNLMDLVDMKKENGEITDQDIAKARDNISKAEADKLRYANAYGRRKYKVKTVPVGYNYDFESDAWYNPNAPQGRRYWRP